MREKIIAESIRSLRKEGLKFSVDMLAKTLKISKKTIYKYFPTKEALAFAMYEQYYLDAIQKAKTLLKDNGTDTRLDLLYLYFDSKQMTRSEIFNKYNLNERIDSYAEEQNDALWTILSSAFCDDSVPDSDRYALRMIIDGTLEKLCRTQSNPNQVIERLVKLL